MRKRFSEPEPSSSPGSVCTDVPDLPGAPPPSPRGRILYENLGIRIDGEGVWHYHGSPIERKELVCLFASALTRDASGRHWLVTPTEMGPIDVEDAAFVCVEWFAAGEGESRVLSLRTNVDEIVTVDDEHPLTVAADGVAPYLRLRHGLQARLARAVYYDLVQHGVETEIDGRRCLAVWSRGRLHPLGWLDDAP